MREKIDIQNNIREKATIKWNEENTHNIHTKMYKEKEEKIDTENNLCIL